MIDFSSEAMMEVALKLTKEIEALKESEIFEFKIKNPDLENAISLKSWLDLSQLMYCKMLTPKVEDTNSVIMRFKKLKMKNSFHAVSNEEKEKYGIDSTFSSITKTQESAFLLHYVKALENVQIDKRMRILNLGVNKGDEFEVIKKYAHNFSNLELVGVDYCSSVIKKAKESFSDNNITFLEGDINNLEELNLGEFDLIITIGTLQSSNLDFNKTFMHIVQNYLNRDGAMIIGFPNCRWVDGEMVYGAMAKNYNFPEMSVLYKDVNFCKKYLQQKKFRVTITGKDYIFLTATSIRK